MDNYSPRAMPGKERAMHYSKSSAKAASRKNDDAEAATKVDSVIDITQGIRGWFAVERDANTGEPLNSAPFSYRDPRKAVDDARRWAAAEEKPLAAGIAKKLVA